MAVFDYRDYHPLNNENWVNHNPAHKHIRDKIKQITPHHGLVYNSAKDWYIITTSRGNLENLTRDWKAALADQGLLWLGEFFGGANCICFKVDEGKPE